MSHYFAFVALVAVLVLIPGPAVILTMQKTVTTGFCGALRVAVGVLAADLVWAAAAAAGMSAVIVASEPAFNSEAMSAEGKLSRQAVIQQ